MPRKIIVGLGNPGQEYRRTRHNLGFWALDLLAQKLEATWRGNSRCKSYLASARYEAHRQGLTEPVDWQLALAKPATYMNRSGNAVSCLLSLHQADPQELLIVCDDVNLPVGKIRIRKKGSAGGHHGLESIIEKIGTSQFARIRLGIKPLEELVPEDLTDFVLSPFRKGEEAVAAESAKRTTEAILFLLEENLDQAMSRYNG